MKKERRLKKEKTDQEGKNKKEEEKTRICKPKGVSGLDRQH
jgi:hypothetical protein